MIPNNNFSVLRFSTSVEDLEYTRFYNFGDVYTLIAPNTKLLPFQIVKPHNADLITAVRVVNYATKAATDITADALAAGLHIRQFQELGYDIIVNPSSFIFPSRTLDANQYTLQIVVGATTWYSEVFTVVADLSGFLRLEYWDLGQIIFNGGHIDYAGNFKNYCYLQTEIGKPEYPFEEEVQQRDGRLFIEKQLSEKRYRFTFLAPEYLCDALRVVRLHDYINIYFNNKKYNVESIIFTPEWQDQGNLAAVTVEFECDTVVKKIGRGVPASTGSAGGDFNNDFNNDFE